MLDTLPGSAATDEDRLARLEAALARGERAAGRLAERHAALRRAAGETIVGIDRLLALPERE
jgi:hypothetical protein